MPLNGLSSRLLFLLLLESVVLVTFTIRPGIEGTIYVPGNFPTIQGAINAASSGDTVYVRSGTYNEDIVINKTVSLVGENKETTCIYGQGGRIAVYVEADSVVVTGFTIKSLGGQSSDGIDLNNVRNCEVSENNVLSSFFGICVFSCSDCTIQDNHVWKNQYGVGGCSCSNCSVSGNEAANNQNGIAIDMSSFIEMKGNNLTGNQFGIVSDFPENGNYIVNNSITNNYYGVHLHFDETNESISGNCITGNTITGNQYGVWLKYSPHTRTAENNITSNFCGVKLETSVEDNSIDSNSIAKNSGYGIWLSSSSNNCITDNSIADNRYGAMLASSCSNTITGNAFVNDGMLISESFSNSVDGNSVNGKPLSYLENVSDRTVENSGQVILVNCNNIRVANLDLAYTSVGLQMWGTNNSLIMENNITDNAFGIDSHHSSNNTLVGNMIANNLHGISFSMSTNNTIYNNNFMNNIDQVNADTSENTWNSSYLKSGNYWSDYAGMDQECGPNQDQLGSDGIGDTPRTINANNIDCYPLMEPDGWLNHPFSIQSNVTITGQIIGGDTLNFTASGPEGQTGYVNVTMPFGIVRGRILMVFIDGQRFFRGPLIITTDGSRSFIYFELSLSIHDITIQYAVPVVAQGGGGGKMPYVD